MHLIYIFIFILCFQDLDAQSVIDFHALKASTNISSFTAKSENNSVAYFFNTSSDSITLDGSAKWYKLWSYNPIDLQGYFTVLDGYKQFLLNLQFAAKSTILVKSLNFAADGGYLLTFIYGGDTLRINNTVLAFNNSGNGSNTALCVVKVKKDGSIIFCKSFPGRFANAQIAALSDGKIVVSGTTGTGKINFDGHILLPFGMGSVSDSDLFVAVLDSTGQVLQVKRFGGGSYDYCFSLLTTDDGSIYLSGDFYSGTLYIDSLTLNCSGGGKFGLPDALLLKLDSTLQLIWTKQASGFGAQRGILVDRDITGKIYWVFEFSNYKSYLEGDTLHGGLDNSMICQLDADGTIIWRRNFATPNSSYISSISFDPENNFWLVVYYQDSLQFGNTTLMGAGKTDNALVKMSPEGDFLNWFNIAGPSWGNIKHIQTIGTQQLFVTGGADTLSFLNLNIASEQRSYFHFILDLNTATTHEAPPEPITISAFPNPISAGALIQVKLGAPVHAGQIALYDALGHLVTQAAVPDYVTQISFTAPRQAGIYYLRVQSGRQRATQKIVVE